MHSKLRGADFPKRNIWLYDQKMNFKPNDWFDVFSGGATSLKKIFKNQSNVPSQSNNSIRSDTGAAAI